LEFGNVEKIIRALLDEPQGLDVAEKQRPLSGEEKLRKDVVTMELEKTTPLEKLCWRQNSKALWLREGDKKPSSSTRLVMTQRKTLATSALSS
jgi:hypothetical protein